MIAGIVGMLAAVVIFILIAVFSAQKANPTIALPLGNFLTSQGFSRIDASTPLFKEISNILSSTADDTFISQIYQKKTENILVCWCTNSDGSDNAILGVLPQDFSTTPWMLLSLPTIGGLSAALIRKSFAALGKKSKRSSFSKAEVGLYGESIDLYLPENGKIPAFPERFINALPQFGNILLRSMGKLILVERLSVSRSDSWEDEAKHILQLTQKIKFSLSTSSSPAVQCLGGDQNS